MCCFCVDVCVGGCYNICCDVGVVVIECGVVCGEC